MTSRGTRGPTQAPARPTITDLAGMRPGSGRPGVTPFLMFREGGVKAMAHYRAVFGDDYEEVAAQQHGGSLVHGRFRVKGQDFFAMDGGPHFTMGEGISFFVVAKDQAEVDRLWTALQSGGGKPSRCGWLSDPFGVSWQVVPEAFLRLTAGPPKKAQAVFAAMLRMDKMIVKELQAAYDGA